MWLTFVGGPRPSAARGPCRRRQTLALCNQDSEAGADALFLERKSSATRAPPARTTVLTSYLLQEIVSAAARSFCSVAVMRTRTNTYRNAMPVFILFRQASYNISESQLTSRMPNFRTYSIIIPAPLYYPLSLMFPIFSVSLISARTPWEAVRLCGVFLHFLLL